MTANLTTLLVIGSFAVLFLAVPTHGQIFQLVLWVHRVAFSTLFVFLVAGQLYQWKALRQIRAGRSAGAVAQTFRRFHLLTRAAPAPIAVTIFLTGLRLIWESPVVNAPSALWLLVLIVGFSVFFFDGIFGYQPLVHNMSRYWEQAAIQRVPMDLAAKDWPRNSDRAQLFAHCASWPLLFTFGVFRWNPANQASALLARLQHKLAFLPVGWPGVVIALLLWVAIGALVLLARSVPRRAT